MVTYNGINHLAMATGDMDKTIRFWRDLLGMRLVAGLGRPGYRHYFFEISENDLIAFFEWAVVEPIEEKDHGRPVKGPFVFDHVSIGVETEEFSHNVKGIDVRKTPQMADKAPSAITKEGPEPQTGQWPAVASPTPKGDRSIYPGAGSEYFHGKKASD